MGIQNRFSDNDPYVQTIQTISADNNQSALNVSIAENDHLRATPASLQPNALTINIANPVPDVTTAGSNTIGSALGDIGQGIAIIGETGGSGDDPGNCFLGNTLVTLWDGELKYLKDDKTGEELPVAVHDPIRLPFAQIFAHQERWSTRTALCFDEDNNWQAGEIDGIFESIAYEYLHVSFADHTADDVKPTHRYFTPEGYVSIKDLLHKTIWHEYGYWLYVTDLKEIQVPSGIAMYNMHVKKYQNYCANRHRVHNIKPIRDVIAEQ